MKYYIPDCGETAEDAEEHTKFMAVDAAEHLYTQRSGWEMSWPLEIVLVDNLEL